MAGMVHVLEADELKRVCGGFVPLSSGQPDLTVTDSTTVINTKTNRFGDLTDFDFPN